VLRGESCEWCGFDARAWSTADLVHTLEPLGPWWRLSVTGVDRDLLDRRPAPETWSPTEYAAHSRDLTEGLGRLLHAVLTIDDLSIDLPPQGDERHDTEGVFEAIVEQLDVNASRLAALAARTKRAGWARTAVVDGEPLDAWDVLGHAVHDATHHLMDVGRGLHVLGAAPASGGPTGRVEQLSVSNGGVPKTPVARARITTRGMEGDRQAVRRHHGRPWQALCLWSSEAIARLAAEGHPIAPGLAGENVTISGIDWRELRPGVRMEIGEALVETSLWALPCKQNKDWFAGGDFGRMHHERELGISRIYAWVLRGGEVHTGDEVVVEP